MTPEIDKQKQLAAGQVISILVGGSRLKCPAGQFGGKVCGVHYFRRVPMEDLHVREAPATAGDHCH